MTNTQTIFPALHYRDAEAALRFLVDAFGAAEKAVYRNDAGVIGHAEVTIEGNLVMFGGTPAKAPPDAAGTPAISLYVVVDDPDAHCARARGAGATIIRDPNETEYGSREYGARDPEGNMWSFGTYDPHAAT